MVWPRNGRSGSSVADFLAKITKGRGLSIAIKAIGLLERRKILKRVIVAITTDEGEDVIARGLADMAEVMLDHVPDIDAGQGKFTIHYTSSDQSKGGAS